jgi:hypothetical protein
MNRSNQLVIIVAGILFAGFPVLALLLSHEQHKPVPLEWLAALALFFIWGIWMFLSGLFKADAESAVSYFAGSVITAIFAAVLFLFALLAKEGWSGGIPFIPAAWNQIVARLFVAFGGLISSVASVACFRKAVKKLGEDDNDVA